MAFGSVFTRFGAAVVGLLSGGAASRAVRPLFELVEHQAWDASPNRLLGVNQLADLVATALTDFSEVTDEAQRQGYQANRLGALVQLALRAPTIGEARDMRRRGVISPAQFRHALRKAGVEPQYDAAAIALLDVLATPTDLVLMAVREVFDPQARAALDLDAEFPPAFAARAADLGISEDLARDYWASHWQLPSYEQLAEMRFRGELSPQAFRDALKAIDYAPTWRDKLETIARRIPTVTDMVRFAVRDVYDPQAVAELGIGLEFPDVFAQEAAQHGLSREHAEQYWRAHWRLPSARQGYQMLWRGEIQEPQLRQLLKALDYPAPWRPRLLNIAYLRPGRIDLKRLLRHGIYDREQVKAGYQAIGYAEPEAEALTRVAEAEQASGLAGSTWANRARSRVFTEAWSDYQDGNADEGELRAMLQAVGALGGEQATIVTLANVARGRSRRDLTQAQVLKLYRKAIWTREQAQAALEDQGMAAGDAGDLLDAQ